MRIGRQWSLMVGQSQSDGPATTADYSRFIQPGSHRPSQRRHRLPPKRSKEWGWISGKGKTLLSEQRMTMAMRRRRRRKCRNITQMIQIESVKGYWAIRFPLSCCLPRLPPIFPQLPAIFPRLPATTCYLPTTTCWLPPKEMVAQ